MSFSVSPVHDDWFIHVSSVLTAISGRKRGTVACNFAPPFVSWIVLPFVGLREVTELLVCTKTTDRAEASEVLEERLREVEAEVKELRADSCWMGGGTGKGQGKKGRGFRKVGAPPAEKRLGEGIPSSWQATGSRDDNERGVRQTVDSLWSFWKG